MSLRVKGNNLWLEHDKEALAITRQGKMVKKLLGFTVVALVISFIFARRIKAEEERDAYYSTKPNKNDEEKTQIPESLLELEAWWIKFRKVNKFPLYAIFLAGPADREIASIFKDHRKEIAEISGSECCFIYYRQLERGMTLAERTLDEHSKWALPIARFLNIDYDRLPCVIYFDRLGVGNYIAIDLRNLSQYEIVEELRKVSQTIRGRKTSKPYDAIKNLNKAKKFKIRKSELIERMSEIGSGVIIGVLTSLVSRN